MDQQIEKEVQSLINTLGFLENGVYYQEPDCFRNFFIKYFCLKFIFI